MLLEWRGRAAFAVLCVLFCGPASAHGGFGDAKSLWSGALHFLTSPVSLASVAGLAVLICGQSERMSFAASALAGILAGLAATFGFVWPAWWAPAFLILAGLMAAAAIKPTRLAALILAGLAGLSAGVAGELDAPSVQGAIGFGGVTTLVLFSGVAILEDIAATPRLAAIFPIACRVLGSWVAAIGLLLTALAIHLAKSQP